MLPSYFDSMFVHLRQKVRLRPKLRSEISNQVFSARTLAEALMQLFSVCKWSSKNTLQRVQKQVKYAQSWTALFRAFSSHRQPSAIFSKVFPAEQTFKPNWHTLLACTEADG